VVLRTEREGGINIQIHEERRTCRQPVRFLEKERMEGDSRLRRDQKIPFLYRRSLPQLPVLLPVVDSEVVGAGGSYVTEVRELIKCPHQHNDAQPFC